MNKLILLILVVLHQGVFAQMYLDAGTTTDTSTAGVEVTSDNGYYSNSIDFTFVKKIAKGSYLTDFTKFDLIKHLRNPNKVACNTQSQVNFYSNTLLKGFRFFGSLQETGLVKSAIPSNLVKLSLWGNWNYMGKSLNNDGTRLHAIHYERLQLGLLKTLSLQKSQLLFGGSVNLYHANRFIDMQLSEFNIFTSEDGDYIDVTTKGHYMRSDSVNSYIAGNGSGAGFDLYFSCKNEKNEYQLSVTDLGKIWWNSHVIQNNYDSTYHFEGFEIIDPSNISEEVSSFIDTLKQHLFHQSQDQYSMRVPVNIRLQYTLYFYNNRASLSLLTSHNYWKFGMSDWCIVPRYLHKYGDVGILAGYHTVGQLHYGISALLKLPMQFNIDIQLQHLNNFIAPDQSFANAIRIGVSKKF